MLGLSRRHYYEHRNGAGGRAANDGSGDGRGRSADSPSDIPKKGWKDILLRVWDEQSKDNVSMLAAGVAYYALLAIFPAVAALVSIYGLVADPAMIENQLNQLGSLLPPEALSIVSDQARKVATTPSQGLGFGLIFGLLLTLWSASRGTNSMVSALNIAYGEKETRGFIKLAMLSMGLTVAGLLFVILAMAMIVAVPAAINIIGLKDTPIGWIASLARWPILAVTIVLALAVFYRYAPDRREPQWRWVSWGSAVATVVWLLGSLGFSIYVSNFGSYNETYGSVGAVVILLLWFNLTSYVVLMGAELNAEIEHQTARDTTARDGRSARPMGRRDAYVADTVGERKAG
ncbi:YihY/virulence factor BrkB family protein (plasmid) [Azospirillum oryzae]|uniref:YihY/virulence factor BrkB family protein n=1 Tax=Azospirillum oryzae TaxID=286727 RepID=A0A6N1AFS7_9PROT|nr:YihY/virulence factor BrkB family protein [Azospirillum oryzae]KAA0588618.1 YihY/virulence factor BrkB family protein [Azospirillum oryzae]QKS49968.1 YihY/virulence factor BrkB family protein [Azospirillum oryzae]GLR82862.1 ribonuclease [Azospirillum oryzae]